MLNKRVKSRIVFLVFLMTIAAVVIFFILNNFFSIPIEISLFLSIFWILAHGTPDFLDKSSIHSRADG